MGGGVDKWLKADVAGNCAAINIKSFSYNLLCLSLKLNFFVPISCVVPIILQWNNKNSLKRPFRCGSEKVTWPVPKKQFQWRGYK